MLPLHVAEPEMWTRADAVAQQWAFVAESLAALGRLVVQAGDAGEVLDALREAHGITALLSHEGTGNARTDARDRHVAARARGCGVRWTEPPRRVVTRAPRTRDGWAGRRGAFVTAPVVPTPGAVDAIREEPGRAPSAADLGMAPDPCPGRRSGGSSGYARATGWPNFRMRSMAQAVASYHLRLDRRATGPVTARPWTDHAPGIHRPRAQKQSGTTGMNTPRIHDPVEQGWDRDPSGAFTRRWVPELAAVPDRFLREPWLRDGARGVLGRVCPHALVDLRGAAAEARSDILAARGGTGFRAEADRVRARHGPRRPPAVRGGEARA